MRGDCGLETDSRRILIGLLDLPCVTLCHETADHKE